LAIDGCAFPTFDEDAFFIVPQDTKTATVHMLKKRFFIFNFDLIQIYGNY
jgi:hypothetical protein